MSLPSVLARLELALSKGGSPIEQIRNVPSSGSHMSRAMGSGNNDVAAMEANGSGTTDVVYKFAPENWDGGDDDEDASAFGHVTAPAEWATFW